MLQVPVFDCFAFDLFSLQQYGFPALKVNIGRREMYQALMVLRVIFITDELIDRGVEFPCSTSAKQEGHTETYENAAQEATAYCTEAR